MPTSFARRVLCLAATLIILAAAQPALAAPQRVVILPFTANAKEDISFLVKGVRDMLATRLAWQDKVAVVEPDLVEPVMREIAPPYDEEKAQKIAKKLSADVVVFGSITHLGKAVSVDASVVQADKPGEPLTTFVQASDLDQVIPRVNDFAQRINAEVFQRPEAVAALKKAEEKASEKYLPQDQAPRRARVAEDEEGNALPANISPLNPLFLKSLSGVESDRYWRSPRIDGQIASLAVADIDLDGKNEVMALMKDSLRIYRLAGRHFALVYELKDGPTGEYLFVDTADLDGDGREEIFVSNLNHYTIQSFVLRWREPGGLEYVAKDLPYFFRAQPDPLDTSKKIMLGQKKDVQEPFVGPIHYMKYSGGSYVPDGTVTKPDRYANVWNMLLADLNGSGRPMKLMLGPSYDLRVYSSGGEQLWQSGEMYNASAKTIEVPPATQLDNPGWEQGWYFLPTRMVLSDLDDDGRAEVVVVRNRDRMGELLGRLKAYYQGTIYSMYWNGMSLVENWRTPRISGYVTDYRIGDVGNVGRPALVLSVNNRVMGGFGSKDTAHFVAFTLKPKAAQTPEGLKEGQL
jgi:TolB-like protein